MIQYTLKSAKARKIPYTNEEEVYGVDVLITTTIVGQPYEGFEKLDIGFCPLEKTDTINQAEQKINVFAQQFITTTYPNVI
jgi:hypothetical protein